MLHISVYERFVLFITSIMVIPTFLARLATGMCTICTSGPQIYEAGVLVYMFSVERPGVSPVPGFVCHVGGMHK
jgi:hypothetical protein